MNGAEVAMLQWFALWLQLPFEPSGNLLQLLQLEERVCLLTEAMRLCGCAWAVNSELVSERQDSLHLTLRLQSRFSDHSFFGLLIA